MAAGAAVNVFCAGVELFSAAGAAASLTGSWRRSCNSCEGSEGVDEGRVDGVDEGADDSIVLSES